MVSAITNRGKVRFIMYRNAINSEPLIKFMTRLTKDAGRKVFLILDNLRAHHSKDPPKWLEAHKEEIEVFYLSSYSPELNPDEYLNNNPKNKVHFGNPIRNRENLEKNPHLFRRTLVKRPALSAVGAGGIRCPDFRGKRTSHEDQGIGKAAGP